MPQNNLNNSNQTEPENVGSNLAGGSQETIEEEPKNGRLTKVIVVLAVVLLAVLAAWALQDITDLSREVVATVGRQDIQRTDWQNQVEARLEELSAEKEAQLTEEQKESLGREVLEEMINRELLAQYAEQNDLNIEKRVESELKEGKDEMGEAEFKKMLEEENLTETGLKELMHRQILIQTVIESVYDELPAVTDEDVQAEYDQRATETDLPPFEQMEEELRFELEEEWARELRPMTYEYLRELIAVEIYLE